VTFFIVIGYTVLDRVGPIWPPNVVLPNDISNNKP